MTNEQVLQEALEHVPGLVRAGLHEAGFAPVGDAGNLWFYQRGDQRLLFGEDGSDYPANLNDPVIVCNGPDDMLGTEYATLRELLYPD